MVLHLCYEKYIYTLRLFTVSLCIVSVISVKIRLWRFETTVLFSHRNVYQHCWDVPRSNFFDFTVLLRWDTRDGPLNCSQLRAKNSLPL